MVPPADQKKSQCFLHHDTAVSCFSVACDFLRSFFFLLSFFSFVIQNNVTHLYLVLDWLYFFSSFPFHVPFAEPNMSEYVKYRPEGPSKSWCFTAWHRCFLLLSRLFFFFFFLMPHQRFLQKLSFFFVSTWLMPCHFFLLFSCFPFQNQERYHHRRYGVQRQSELGLQRGR